MERFEDESGDMSSGGPASEPSLKSTSIIISGFGKKFGSVRKRSSRFYCTVAGV